MLLVICFLLTLSLILSRRYLANIYLFKVNNGNTRKRCKTCSYLTIKIPKRLLLTFNLRLPDGRSNRPPKLTEIQPAVESIFQKKMEIYY